MKIRKLQLKNIGVFDDETIEFKECDFNKGKEIKDRIAEIHIFTGQNGSGKTTILQALASAFGFQGDFKTLLRNSFEKRFQKSTPQSELYSVEIDFMEKDEDCSTNKLKSVIKEQGIFSVPIIERSQILTEFSKLFLSNTFVDTPLSFCPFSYSGYRRINDEVIEIGKEVEENPLHQALEFVKDENSKFNINQWLGQNLLNSSLSQTKNKSEEVNKFNNKINRLEKVINDIIANEIKDNEIRFEMQSATRLVLIKNNVELDFDVLPDGLKSLISWIGDLLMRLDSLKWKDDTPIFDREIILFLDEIEVHLHPAWQRKVLPVVQKLFKNSQIFVSTHSPFVVNSVDDAWVYKLKLENGKAKVAKPIKSEDGISYQTVLSEIFDIDKEFGGKTQDDLDKFYSIVRNGKKVDEKELKKLAKSLAVQSEELNSIVQIELRQLSRRKGKQFSI